MRSHFSRRSIGAGLLLALTLVTGAIARAQTHVVGPRASPCLNLRPEPSLRSQPYDCIFPAAKVTVISENDRWRRIRLEDGREGWVIGSYLLPAPGAPTAAPSAPAAAPDAPPTAPSPPPLPSTAELERSEGSADALKRAQAEIQRLSNAADTAERMLAATEAERADLARRLERASGERDASRTAESGLRERLTAAEAARDESAAEVGELTERLGRIEAERDRSAEEATGLGNELQGLKNDRDLSSEKVAGLESELQGLKTERDHLSEQVAGLAAELERLKNEMSRLREASSVSEAELEARVEKAESAEEESRREMERHLAEARETPTARIAALEAEIVELRASVRQSRSEATQLERKLDETVVELAKARAAGEKLEARLARQRPKPKVAALEAEVAGLRAEIEALQTAGRAASEPAAAVPVAEREPAVAEEAAESATSQPLAVPAVPFAQREEAAGPESAPAAPSPTEPVRPREPLPQGDAESAVAEAMPAVPGDGPDDGVERLPSPTEEAQGLVEAWARAWSDQRVEDYLDFYSERFEPTGGVGRSAWAERRRDRLASPGFIEIGVEEPEVVAWGEDRLTLRFVQSYRSDTYQDRVVKDLVLVREAGGWKILSESAAAVDSR